MKNTETNNTIIEGYLHLLSNLSPTDKLDLIARLSQSLKQDYQREPSSLKSLFGAYKGEETAEEMIEAIRNSRVSNRNIEPL